MLTANLTGDVSGLDRAGHGQDLHRGRPPQTGQTRRARWHQRSKGRRHANIWGAAFSGVQVGEAAVSAKVAHG